MPQAARSSVKDLVGSFERRPDSPISGSRIPDAGAGPRRNSLLLPDAIHSVASLSTPKGAVNAGQTVLSPPPTPARFIQVHPLLKPTAGVISSRKRSEPTRRALRNLETYGQDPSGSILDVQLPAPPNTLRASDAPQSGIAASGSDLDITNEEDDIAMALLSDSQRRVQQLQPQVTQDPFTEQSVAPTVSSTALEKERQPSTHSFASLPIYRTTSTIPQHPPQSISDGPLPYQSTSTIYPQHHFHHSHSGAAPIPARTLFSRKAVPLSLPELDVYLEKIEPPSFTDRVYPSIGKPVHLEEMPKRAASPVIFRMFSPLEYLAGTSLTNLKYNSKEPTIWRDRNTIVGTATNWVLGITGSSALAYFYSLQGVYDSVQVFSLVLSSVVRITDHDIGNSWRKLFLGTIPNILALNFVPVLTQSIIFLSIVQLISFALLFYFHRATGRFLIYSPALQEQEGLLAKSESEKANGWGVLVVSFILMVLYLPISTIAVHGLVWSSDFWPVPNPYTNATSSPPHLEPLGPSSEFRDPLDFCWTTTMNKESVNWAPLVIVISFFTICVMTIYFPIRLWKTTQRCLPHVELYSELGRRRTTIELKHEYQRLLARDRNPLSYLYNEYRRTWGAYKSMFLAAKLCALLVVAIVDPNNCLFRNYDRQRTEVVRQGVLLSAMGMTLIAQSVMAPYIDPVSNASEWTSRANYFLTSGVGLLVALNVKGKELLNGAILYVIYVITYGLNIYFAIINWSWVRLLVKRIARRIDFSVDIFSPHLDITPGSHHPKRRIHQETLSTLLLATPECHMPKSQKMFYNQARDCEWPPYLLDFCGTPAERHAENLKILREVGSLAYIKGIEMCYGSQKTQFEIVQDIIESEFTGPDAFWRPPDKDDEVIPRCSDYFGNAWWIPFPPTLVIRYDHGGFVILKAMEQFEAFVEQNSDPLVTKKRELRLALRAMDGEVAFWPYTHTELVGARSWQPWGGPKYKIQSTIVYESAKFEIIRHAAQHWEGLYLGSGFDVRLRYTRNVEMAGSIIGLDDDFDLTTQLAQFLMLNRVAIERRLGLVVSALEDYRNHLRKISKWKRQVLSYRFLSSVYDCPRPPNETKEIVEEIERDLRVRQLLVSFNDAFVASDERMRSVARSKVTTWWYIFWDDFWRRNYRSITALRTHEQDFNPHYPTSIAYRPLPRPVLESFLRQRGLFGTSSFLKDFIHVGLLNKIFIRLNQIAFEGSSKIVHIHVGDRSTELELSEIDLDAHSRSATIDTGAGTDHDDEEIRARPSYKWEGVYDDPLRGGKRKKRWRPWNKFAVWFGITPRETTTLRTNGVAFDVKLVQGRYVVLDDDDYNEN